MVALRVFILVVSQFSNLPLMPQAVTEINIKQEGRHENHDNFAQIVRCLRPFHVEYEKKFHFKNIGFCRSLTRAL